MKNDRTREEDEEEKGWLKRNAANDSRASSPPRINPPVIQYQISESSEELTYSSPRVLSGRIERYTRAQRERGGEGEEEEEGMVYRKPAALSQTFRKLTIMILLTVITR